MNLVLSSFPISGETITSLLLHSLWQGALVVWVVYVVGCRCGTDSARHRVHFYGMVALVMFPLLTLTVGESIARNGAWLSRAPRPAVLHAAEAPEEGQAEVDSYRSDPGRRSFYFGQAGQEAIGPFGEFSQMQGRDTESIRAVSASELPRQVNAIRDEGKSRYAYVLRAVAVVYQSDWQRWVAVAWLVGICLGLLRLVGGVFAVHWLCRGCKPADDSVLAIAGSVCQRLGISLPAIWVSDRAEQAFAVGMYCPRIVLPEMWINQLRPCAVEAILSHELSHIQRRDLSVIFAQRLIHIVIFYQPAMWWLSSRVECLREWCCDALAVRMTGRPLEYAQALEQAARWRQGQRVPRLAAGVLGVDEMRLLARVRNVLGNDSMSPVRQPRGLAAPTAAAMVAVLVLAGMLVAPPAGLDSAMAQAVEQDPPKESEKEKPQPKVAPEREKMARESGSPKERGAEQMGPRELAAAKKAEEIRDRIQKAVREGRVDEAERLERELVELKRAQAGRMEVHAGTEHLAELHRQLGAAIKQGRVEEVEELGRQISMALRRERPRPDGPRPDGPRPDGPRPDGPRPDGPRPDGPRPDGPRPDGPRPGGFGGPDEFQRERMRMEMERRREEIQPMVRELFGAIGELREEVGQLRRELNELRERR